jgi:hypothetical protein
MVREFIVEFEIQQHQLVVADADGAGLLPSAP